MCFVCFCVFSYRSQVTRPMYFACFCVFSWDLRTHNQHPPCVFFCFCVFLFINFYFGHKSERGKTPNVFFVFLCFFLQVSGKTTNVFCVFLCFYQRLVWSYLRPGQPLNMFYVFLCFSTKVSGHTTHVFRVFLCFFLNNVWYDPSSERGTHPMCFMCFCVFHHRSQGKQPMCILRVFVFFFASKGQMNRVTPFVFCVFLCFFLRPEDTQPTSSMCFCVFCL